MSGSQDWLGILYEYACSVASYPGHSHVFNVTRRNIWEPGDEATCSEYLQYLVFAWQFPYPISTIIDAVAYLTAIPTSDQRMISV